MEKFCPASPTVVWNRNKSNFHIHFLESGSKIYMTSESINQDPELLWMDGLETNGIFLEQIEGISKKMYDKARERAGSWIITPMPPALVLGTTNPTLSWPKTELYEKYKNGTLKPPFYFLEALPDDNPYVTQDQWAAWKTLDTVSYNARIKGDWDSFAVGRPFAHALNDKKHLRDENGNPFNFEYDPEYPLMLGFDFNVSPMTCVSAQYIDSRIRFVREFRINNSSTAELCQQIKAAYPFALFIVTGDATGRNRSALTGGTINHYIIIKQELRLTEGQLKQPSVNPSLGDSRVLVNSILENFPPAYNECCKYLIEDLKFVEVDHEGKVDKTKDPERGHLLDGHNYILNTFFSHLIRLDPSTIVDQHDIQEDV